MGFETLKDGSGVLLRQLTSGDLEPLLAFFRALPEEERRYLRNDVTEERVVGLLLREAETGAARRVAAFAGDEIVAYAALLLSEGGWQLAEIRVMVAPEHRGKNLGRLMIAAMVKIAEQSGLRRVVVKVLAPQLQARRLCEEVGFRVDAVLPGHAMDRGGQPQDLVVLSCEIDSLSSELRDLCRHEDWPDG